MELNERQKRHLRKLGHELRPVVMTGADGLKPSVLDEVELALAHHELIKIRVRAGDRGVRDEMIRSICEQTHATLVQRIGHVALLYRPDPDASRINLPR